MARSIVEINKDIVEQTRITKDNNSSAERKEKAKGKLLELKAEFAKAMKSSQ